MPQRIGIPAVVDDLTRRGLDSVEGNVKQTADKVTSDFDKAGRSTEGFGQKLSGLGDFLGVGGIAGVAGIASGAVVAFGVSLLNTGDELAALSDMSGLSAEALQEWGYIAEQSGGSIEDVADAAREMQLRLAEAAELGTGPAIDALDLLGVTLQELDGLDADQQFALLRDRISEVENPAQRLFVAEELLGGASERLAGTIKATTGEMVLLREAAADLGVQLTNEEVAKLDAYEQKIADLGAAASNLGTDSLFVAAEALTTFGRGILQITDFLGIELGESLEETRERILEETQAWEDAEVAAGNLTLTVDGLVTGVDAQTEALISASGSLAQFTTDTNTAAAAQYQLSIQINQARRSQYLFDVESGQFQGTPYSVDQVVSGHAGFLSSLVAPIFDGGGGGGGGGGRGGGGGGGTSTRSERPERVDPIRLGDYLRDVEGYDRFDIETLQRFGPSDRYGSNQRINLGQNIAGLSPEELRELLLDVGDARGEAFDRFEAAAREDQLAGVAAREERVMELMKRQLEELERMGRQPCPPVTLAAPIIAEREAYDVVENLVRIVTPVSATSNLTGAEGGIGF